MKTRLQGPRRPVLAVYPGGGRSLVTIVATLLRYKARAVDRLGSFGFSSVKLFEKTEPTEDTKPFSYSQNSKRDLLYHRSKQTELKSKESQVGGHD